MCFHRMLNKCGNFPQNLEHVYIVNLWECTRKLQQSELSALINNVGGLWFADSQVSFVPGSQHPFWDVKRNGKKFPGKPTFFVKCLATHSHNKEHNTQLSGSKNFVEYSQKCQGDFQESGKPTRGKRIEAELGGRNRESARTHTLHS